MENKKLLKYLLKDLNELEEMFAEKGKNCFDDIEMEFVQNRVSGAIRLVQLFLEHESDLPVEKPELAIDQKQEFQHNLFQKVKTGNRWIEETPDDRSGEKPKPDANEKKSPGVVIEEKIVNNKVDEKVTETVVKENIHVNVVEEKIAEANKVVDETVTLKKEKVEINIHSSEDKTEQEIKEKSHPTEKELHLDEELQEVQNKRLGDTFQKEKSVNDLMADDLSKLEQKISNRPVASIHSAIGINDRFQYIRELFEGSTDNFVKAVSDLDSMNDINEAVDYLKTNFKWKKNETSLKFVNLIKRRFPNE